MFKKIFEDLGLSDSVHRVYLRLIECGPSSARMIAENLNIPRPSIYDALKILINRGLVIEKNEGNKKIFHIDDLKNLPRLLNKKIENLQKEERELNNLLPKLINNASTIEPKIKFYSGIEGVHQVLNDMLWYENIETLAFWPMKEMLDLLGKEYLEDFNRKRIRRKLSTKSLWPENMVVDLKNYPFLGSGTGFYRERRIAPKKVSWNMSYWIYADKVAFISSRKETFGFVIHSKDFAEMQKTQFELVWQSSKPIKPEPHNTDKFLGTV